MPAPLHLVVPGPLFQRLDMTEAVLQTSVPAISNGPGLALAGPLSRVLTVLNIATVPELVGQAGHIAITHDGTYGALNVKAVAIEPSTGFSFDTPGAYVGR